MIYVYYFLTFLALAIMINKKKNISLITIYLVSTIIYYINAYVGKIYEGSVFYQTMTSWPIYKGSYIVLVINMVLIILFLLAENDNRNNQYRCKISMPHEHKIIRYFILIIFILSLYMCVEHNLISRTTYSKLELGEETGTFGTYYKFLTCFPFVYVFTKEGEKYNILWKFLATFPIFTTFLLGHRSFVVIGVIAIFFDKIYRSCLKYDSLKQFLVKKIKYFYILAILLFLTLSIKGVTYALFTKDYERIGELLTSSDYYAQILYTSEYNTIMNNLDHIVKQDYQIETTTYGTLWAYAIPFLTDDIDEMFGVKKFSKTYQKAVYAAEGKDNRASTYLGESYANGGYLVVPMVVSAYLLFLIMIFGFYRRCRGNVLKATILLIAIDSSFYIQRNALGYELGRIRLYLYIAIIVYIFIMISQKNKKIIY